MIAGMSGSQKSGFALFWTAQMGLPTLYFAGDMTAFEATSRLVEMQTMETEEEVEAGWLDPEKKAHYLASLKELNISFSFGSPITWNNIDDELDAYMELHNCYPSVLVFDNLMDFEGGDSDYATQTAIMQDLTSLSRELGITVIVLTHATEKSNEALVDPFKPPARRNIKNGLSEKPQLTFTVALQPEVDEFRIAVVKQRSGRQDPTGNSYVRLRAYPEITRFGPRQ